MHTTHNAALSLSTARAVEVGDRRAIAGGGTGDLAGSTLTASVVRLKTIEGP